MSDTGPAIENMYFDQQFCGKVTRVGAIACAATLVGDVLFLALVDLLHSHCVGEIQKLSGGGSIWELVAAVGVWAAWGNEGNTLGAEIARRALPAPNGQQPH